MGPIGKVLSMVKDKTDYGWGETEARIELSPEFSGGLRGLKDFSHAIVLTWLHKSNYQQEKHLQRRPRNRSDLPLLGIFAQRGKDRPNPIGVTAVKILRVDDDSLTVSGLDAIDGTPVLDIKPYFPSYDKVDNCRIPAWVDELMEGYF